MSIIVRNTYEGIHDVFCMIEEERERDDLKEVTEYIKRYKKLIGRNINSIRKKLGMSFKRLSLASGISPSTLLRLENAGGDPRYETLEKLAATFSSLGEPTKVHDFLRDDFQEYEGIPGSTLVFSPGERKLLMSAQKLNNKGQEVAAERVEELTKISDYRKENV